MSSKSRERRAAKRRVKQFNYTQFENHVKSHVMKMDDPVEVMDRVGERIETYKEQAFRAGVPPRIVAMNAFRLLQGRDPIPYRGAVKPPLRVRKKLRRD